MICEQCKKEGQESIVFEHGGSRTLIGFTPFYDEQGAYHVHNPNTLRLSFSCSCGHSWSVEEDLSPCPQGDYPRKAANEGTAPNQG